MKEEDLILLNKIAKKCKEDAPFLTHIINAGIGGIMESEREMRIMAADMETFASAMCFLVGQSRVSKKLKEEMSNLALSKLGKYYGKSFINWASEVSLDGDH